MKAINEVENHYAIVVVVDKASQKIVAVSTQILQCNLLSKPT